MTIKRLLAADQGFWTELQPPGDVLAGIVVL